MPLDLAPPKEFLGARHITGGFSMLPRRSLLTGSLAASLVPALGWPAKAQVGDRSRDVIQVVAGAKGQAENLFASALYANFSTENVSAIEGANEKLFGDLSGIVGGIPAEESIIYAEPAQTMLAELMMERGVALVPPALTAILASAPAAASSDDLPGVAADILKRALGVKNVDASKLPEIVADLSLSPILSRVAALIKAGNLAVAAEFLRALLTQLGASPQVIPAIEKALGSDGAKEVLAAVSARYVVLVGWPVLLAAVLYAIAQDRNRLVAAIEKAAL
jgi:hypothetical protein